MGGGRRTALLLLAVAAAAAGQAAAEQFGDGAVLCSAGALHDQANQGTVLCAATSKPTCAGTVKIDNAEDCCEHTIPQRSTQPTLSLTQSRQHILQPPRHLAKTVPTEDCCEHPQPHKLAESHIDSLKLTSC